MAKVVLTEPLRNYGAIGDVVTVKDGFARNYLYPRGKALVASRRNLERFELDRAAYEIRQNRIRRDAERLARSLETWSPAFILEANDNGNLYQTFRSKQLVVAAEAYGLTIRAADIVLASPVRSVGVHYAVVRVHPEVEQSIKFYVGRSQEEIDARQLEQLAGDRRLEALRLIDRMAIDQQEPEGDFTSRLIRVAELVSSGAGQAARAALKSRHGSAFEDAVRSAFRELNIDCLIRVAAEHDNAQSDVINVTFDVCGALPISVGNASTFRLAEASNLRSASLKLSVFSPSAEIEAGGEPYSGKAPDGETGSVGIKRQLRRPASGGDMGEPPILWSIATLNDVCVHRRAWRLSEDL